MKITLCFLVSNLFCVSDNENVTVFFFLGAQSALVFSCNFDDDTQFENGAFCGFVQSEVDGSDWSRGSRTQSQNTGPDADVSGSGKIRLRRNRYLLQNLAAFFIDFLGQFAFTEASNIAEGTIFDLHLPQLTSSSSSFCLKFMYSLNGQHIGRLDVIKRASDNSEDPIFSEAGSEYK